MAQEYSVGDRVRVLRKVTDVALSDGAVIKVHSNGAVDVAYDVDGSVGLSLTKEKDIFQLVGEDGKVMEKVVAVAAKPAKVSAKRSVGCMQYQIQYTGTYIYYPNVHVGRCMHHAMCSAYTHCANHSLPFLN